MGLIKTLFRALRSPAESERQAKLRALRRTNRGSSGVSRRHSNRDREALAPFPRILGNDAEHGASDENDPLQRDGARSLSVEQKNAYARRMDAIVKQRDDFAYAIPDDLDDEDTMIEYAKKEILASTSNEELLMKAELLINEAWLGEVDAMPGNIYRMGAFGDFFPNDDKWCSPTMLTAVARFVGCLCIFAIQLVGPPLIFFSAVSGVGRMEDKVYHWEHWIVVNHRTEVDPLFDWRHVITTKCLGMVLMCAFLLNALFICLNERKSWKQIYFMFKFLDKQTTKFSMEGGSFLYLGCFVNNWLCLWISLASFVVIGPSRSPKDLIMDSLGLLFLYNLDDLDGDLGFVTEDDWPGDRLQWIYQNIVEPGMDEDPIDIGIKGKTAMGLYDTVITIVSVFVVLLPGLAAITPFFKIAPQ